MKTTDPELSIIIPVLNEESEIIKCLKNLSHAIKNDRVITEVIIIDGNSTDNTVRLARDFCKTCDMNIRIFSVTDKGKIYKAKQLNLGSEHANGDIFLYLHVDTILPYKALSKVKNAIENGFNGGAFNIRFHPKNIRMHLVEILDRLLIFFTKNFFGDQAIFLTKKFYNEVKGYPDVCMMEDLVMSDRLRQSKKFIIIKEPVTTSSRRFYEKGILKQMFQNAYLYNYFRFFNGDPVKIKQIYEKNNKITRTFLFLLP